MAMRDRSSTSPRRPVSEAERRAARRERARIVQRRRRRIMGGGIVLGLVAVIIVVAVVASGGSSGSRSRRGVARGGAVVAASGPAGAGAPASVAGHAQPPQHSVPRAPRRPRGPSPGSLPQTSALPSAHTAAFVGLMRDLWSGVIHDAVGPALPAFFPRRAYEELKSIGAPGSDWQNRLVGDYRLDLGAAHQLLGAHATGARLLAVHVVGSYAHWVPPGVCDNSVGYYEVPNARVVYREDGRVRSFGIASMISWRGVWYVVHLGAVLREGDAGVVDEPSAGAGSSAYSGTC
jgi:hypothetical protein